MRPVNLGVKQLTDSTRQRTKAARRRAA